MVQGMLGATVFRSAGISIRGGIPEVEGCDLGFQDELTRLTLSSSHPEGTSSPEERGHSDADATKPQLDARHPVLVGSELGERRLRPLPMTRPTAETPPLSGAAGGHLGCGRKSFMQALCKKEDQFFPFRRRRSDPKARFPSGVYQEDRGVWPRRKF